MTASGLIRENHRRNFDALLCTPIIHGMWSSTTKDVFHKCRCFGSLLTGLSTTSKFQTDLSMIELSGNPEDAEQLLMKTLAQITRVLGMTDEAWQRHANPWSVYTRFAAIPAMILAIWSRVWISWWALVPVGGVIIWLWLNPFIFPAVTTPRSWVAKGIFGEKLWLQEAASGPAGYRVALRWLLVPALCGGLLVVWGLVQLLVWPTCFGATLIALAQLWRIDRVGLLYELKKGE